MKIPETFKTISICVAMYCLLLLLFELERNDVLRPRLERIHPHGKFWCIKLLVFATALQKVLCETVLTKLNLYEKFVSEIWNSEAIGVAVQSFLLCCECLLFSVWFFCLSSRRVRQRASKESWEGRFVPDV